MFTTSPQDYAEATWLPDPRSTTPVRCRVCGMRADGDPYLHSDQYGHDPVAAD